MQKENGYSKSNVTKKKIFDAATHLINEKGFYNTTVSDITKAANVAKGAFYYYFETKHDIITYAYSIMDSIYEEAFLLTKNEQGFKDKLTVFAVKAYEELEKQIGLEAIKMSTIMALSTDINPLGAQPSLTKSLKMLYDEALENDEICDIPFDTFSVSLMSCFVGSEYFWIVSNNENPLTENLKMNLEIFINGVICK